MTTPDIESQSRSVDRMRHAQRREVPVLGHRKLRRATGALLVVAGALVLWLVPETAFEGSSVTGIVLLITGVVLELAGIAVEHRRGRGS